MNIFQKINRYENEEYIHALKRDVPGNRYDAGFAADVLELAVGRAGEDLAAVANQEFNPTLG